MRGIEQIMSEGKRRKAKGRVQVEQKDGEEVPTKVLATAILQIAEAAQKVWTNGPLTKRAVCILIRDATTPPVALSTIEAVLDAAADLKRLYVR